MKSNALSFDDTQIQPADVERLLALREARTGLKSRLALMDQALEDAEGELVARIDAGADPSRSGYDVAVKETERRFPSWKEHFLSIAGKEAADRVLAGTEPKLYRNLVIQGKE